MEGLIIVSLFVLYALPSTNLVNLIQYFLCTVNPNDNHMLGTNPLLRNQTTDEERMCELREERQKQKLEDAKWDQLRKFHRDDQGLWNDENFTWTLKLLPMSREAAAEALTKKGIRVPTPNCLVTAKKNQYDIARKTITMSVSTPEKPEMVVLGRKPETGIMWTTVSRQLCEINMVSTKLEDTAAGLSIGVKASISMLQPGNHVSVVLLLLFRCALQSRAHT